MNADNIALINNEIIPLIANGDITLFLGAGASIGTPSINGLTIPSSEELIERICIEAGYTKEIAKTTDLPTAFGVGEDEIDNFENFLLSNFTAKKAENWQLKIFQNWWRAIFTTNIDTIPEVCLEINKAAGNQNPNYKIFNYKDREPVQSIPTDPPVVYLHGSVSRAKEGFIFDSVSYAENSVNQSDWLVKAALHISHGGCLFVGSKFKESDIETALRRRNSWDSDAITSCNWIVLKDFTEIEEKSYLKRGITPIRATAEEFFSYVFSQVTPLTRHKFIKRKAPFLSENTDDKSLAWFTSNMSLVSEAIAKASKRNAPFSLFYNGDMPDWFYIQNNVPARFSSCNDIASKILDFENSSEKALVIPVLGSLASGKSTVAMQVCAELAKTRQNIYHFTGLHGIDIDATWNVLKDLKGLVVIFIDSSSSYFYALNGIIERFLDRPTSCKICLILEERTIHFQRNKRHFTQVPPSIIREVRIKNLNESDADLLLKKTKELGINFEKLKGLDRDAAIGKIIDYETGYNGDLLATLYDLSSRKSYKERLKEEYDEIKDLLAIDIYQTISLVTASRLEIPVNYLCEIHAVSVEYLMKIINDQLKDKINYRGISMTMKSRHHSIAEYHIANNFGKDGIRESIIKLMRCVSTKFAIDDIKKHPIGYKIYSKLLSYHYLTEEVFPGRDNYKYIHDIYSECQRYFAADGIFWLQYGRFLEKDNQIDQALHCFKKGLDLYDSFQLRHALGQLLLKKFRLSNSPCDEDFKIGVEFLTNEIDSRGTTDPYPYTALGDELIKIFNLGRKQEECRLLLRDLINRGIKMHREDQYFKDMVARYVSKVSGSGVI